MKIILLWAILILLPETPMAVDYQTAILPNGAEYYAGRFVITTRTGVPELNMEPTGSGIAVTGVQSIDYLCEQFNVTSIEPYYQAPVRSPRLRALLSRMYIFHIPVGTDIEVVCETFRGTPEIECADIYDIPRTTYFPNDPSRSIQWHLAKVDVYEAWDFFRGDTTRYGIVGIVDTGVYWAHPDLAPNMWINVAEDINGNGTMDSGDLNDIDDDGNGYTDDVIGWDLGMNDNNPNENTPTHGTHVAGCVSEATDNALQGAGVGFSIRLMAVKGTNSQGQLSAVYQGMIYAADNGAHVINCSWGSQSYNESNQNIINTIWNEGVAIVAAAGNNNDSILFYPAAYNNVVAVAATDSDDHKAYFSNYGTWIDVSAPGASIFATWDQNGMVYLSGTSMPCAITSGIMGLIKAAHPEWTNDDLVTTIIISADNIDTLNPSYAGQLGSGRVNAYSALGSARDYIGEIDSTLYSCPNGDYPYRITLHDWDGEPVIGFDDILLDFSNCSISYHCGSQDDWPLVPPAGPSNGSGELYFYPHIGRVNYGAVVVRSLYDSLYAIQNFKSFDNNGDSVVNITDWTGGLENDYNLDDTVTIADYNIFNQHMGHFCNTPLALSFARYMTSDPPSGHLNTGDSALVSLIARNSSPITCSVSTVEYYYRGFNIGYNNWTLFSTLNGTWPMEINQTDMFSTTFIIPPGNHGCLMSIMRLHSYPDYFVTYMNLDSQGENGGNPDLGACESEIGGDFGFPIRILVFTDLPEGWTYSISDTIFYAPGILAITVMPAPDALPGDHGSVTAVGIDTLGVEIGSITCEYIVPGCTYMPGDANGNEVFNGLDVGYSVNYLKGLGPSPPISCDCPPHGIIMAAADANGNCVFNGLDVTYSVNYLKGVGLAPLGCVDCLPGD